MTDNKNWMVIGYSKKEGEYPVALDVTEEEANKIASENNKRVEQRTGHPPKHPDVARCMSPSKDTTKEV